MEKQLASLEAIHRILKALTGQDLLVDQMFGMRGPPSIQHALYSSRVAQNRPP